MRGCQSEISDESVVYKKVVPVVALLSQLFDGEHGHGFIDATSMNEAGYSVEYFALLILIILSSNGCRITSSTFRENSGNSSRRKNLPHCNSLIVNHKANNNIHISNPHHSRNRSFIVIVA